MSKKMASHGLGRGLGALLGDIENESENLKKEQPVTGDTVREVSLNDIDVDPGQPRKDFDEEALRELADSIASVGVIQPIVLMPKGSRYTIVVGERRFRASRLAGRNTIPAIVRSFDEMTRLKTALIENLQRSDLNPVETALGIKTLMERCDYTQEEAAAVVGKSRSAVANTLRLLTLENSVLEMLKDGRLSAGHARALVNLSPERQKRLAELTVQQGWSVRQLERISALPEQPPHTGPRTRRPEEIGQLEQMARGVFGTRARIDGDVNKGRLIISYSSQEDLEGIWNVLESIGQGQL